MNIFKVERTRMSRPCLICLIGLILMFSATGIEGLICYHCDPCDESRHKPVNETCTMPVPVPDSGSMACAYDISSNEKSVRRRCRFVRHVAGAPASTPTGHSCRPSTAADKVDCFCYSDHCNLNLPGEASPKKHSKVNKCPVRGSGTKVKASFVLILPLTIAVGLMVHL